LNVGFVLNALAPQHLFDIRQDRSEPFLTHDVDDQSCIEILTPPTEHSRIGLVHEEPQIGATPGEQEWRVGEDGRHIGFVAAYRCNVRRIEAFRSSTRAIAWPGYEIEMTRG
jgi:hypothetical protein